MFCSWNCAKAELLNTQGFSCGGGILLLDHMARRVFGYDGPDIVPAPPKTRLRFFYPGKDALDIDTFRAGSQRYFTTTIQPPLLSCPEVYEEHAVGVGKNWSVKGIRVKQSPPPQEPKIEKSTSSSSSASKNRGPDTTGQFEEFVKQRTEVYTSGTNKPVQSEGTLLDWQEAKKVSVG